MADNRIDPTGSLEAGGDPLARLLGFNTYGDRKAALDRQFAASQALRSKPRQKYSSWAGALAGGMGDVLDSVNSKMSDDRLQGEERELIGSEDARTGELLNLPGVRERIMSGLTGAGAPGAPTAAPAAPAQTGGIPTIPYPSQAALGPMQGPELPMYGAAGSESLGPMQGPEIGLDVSQPDMSQQLAQAQALRGGGQKTFEPAAGQPWGVDLTGPQTDPEQVAAFQPDPSQPWGMDLSGVRHLGDLPPMQVTVPGKAPTEAWDPNWQDKVWDQIRAAPFGSPERNRLRRKVGARPVGER